MAAGKASLAGQGADAALTREVAKLQREVESREQVIGELTVANRILKKLALLPHLWVPEGA